MGRLFNIRCGRNGGLVFWEIGRFGGSFYLQSHAANQRKWAERDERALTNAACAALEHEFMPDNVFGNDMDYYVALNNERHYLGR